MKPMPCEDPNVFQTLVDALLRPFTPISYSTLNSPDAWIKVYRDQLRNAVTTSEIFRSEDLDHLSLQLYPRCTLYVLAYSKTHRSTTTLAEFRQKMSQWSRLEDLEQFIEFQSILESIRASLSLCGPSDSELHTLDMILRFDILFITAKVLLWLRGKEQRLKFRNETEERAQILLDLLQSLLDCHPEGSSKAKLLDATFRLSNESGRVPSCLLLHKLKIDSCLGPAGSGSFGDVWKGWRGDNLVAVKSMRQYYGKGLEHAIKSFAREAVLWRQLRHPNILPFYGVHLWAREVGPLLCLVSPFMENGNVLEYMKESKCKDKLRLLLDVARGLEYMHNFKPPTIHGDLKANNILITPSGDACIADFGLCTFTRDHGYQMTNRNSSGGTGAILHCAPELFSSGSVENSNTHSSDTVPGPYKSKESDVYAFGCLCFEIYTMRPRFSHIPSFGAIPLITNDRPVPQPTNVESAVWSLIQSCWERRPSARPPMTKIVSDLGKFIKGADDSQNESIFKWDEQIICQLNSPWAARKPPFGLGPDCHNNMNSVSTLLSDEDIRAIGRNDIIIALMGPSGVGKSSFVNTVLGHQVAVVGRSLESCTQSVRAYGCLHPDGSGRKVIIVDTPGFDDSDRTDYEVLRDIVTWLASTYKKDIVLTGILQLHSIAEARMRGTPRKNLEVFRKLCGEHALKNVIMTTTFWDKVPLHISEMRESQLRTDFWGDMIEQGCRLDRFYPPTMETAWRLISAFDNNARRPALTVQTEIVDQKKKLHQTSAFGALFEWWSKKLKGLRRRFSASNKQPSEKELFRAEAEMRKMTRNNSTRSSSIGEYVFLLTPTSR